MAKWFRSEPMEYISIVLNEDASHDCLAQLGTLGAIQFTDVRFSGGFFVAALDFRFVCDGCFLAVGAVLGNVCERSGFLCFLFHWFSQTLFTSLHPLALPDVHDAHS